MADVNEFAGVVALAIKAAMAPVLERVAIAESRLARYEAADQALMDLRERVKAAETAAAMLRADPQVEQVIARLADVETQLAAFADVTSLEQRLDAVEAKPEQKADVSAADVAVLRDRLVALETKADGIDARLAAPNPLSAAVEKTDRALADLLKDVGTMRERIAVAEVKTGVPGPAGPAGRDGADGVDGVGFDDLTVEQTDERSFAIKAMRGERVKVLGTVSFPVQLYRDVWEAGRSYVAGDCVTWAGSEWHCNQPTDAKPGDGSKAWTLKVKRGRDGRDGRDAPVLPVVSIGGTHG